MNDMDEITYWVYTKRAPCLMNYDNLIRKQYEATQVAQKCKSVKSVTEEMPLPKKKKRKLSLFEEDGVSVTKQPNDFFEESQNKDRTVLSSCKSDSLESEIDFNIKNSSVQGKTKNVKVQKNGRTLHKKNKVVTSTPLRRTTRKARNCVNNDEQLNISFETFLILKSNSKLKSKKSSTKTPCADRTLDVKKEAAAPEKPRNETALNGQFEDLSDVSGFTANYIRSTKLHSNANPHRSLRSKGSRNLSRQLQPQPRPPGNTNSLLMHVNKAVNATDPPHTSALNYSTDSSQNIINLVTIKSDDKNNKSTSELKFVDAKVNESNCNTSKSISKTDKDDKDISLQNTTNSRYPKRYKNHSIEATERNAHSLARQTTPSKRKTPCKNVVDSSSSHRKENPSDSSLSKTRSGRNLALTLRQPDNAVFVYSNSSEPSTLIVVNVASPAKARAKRISAHKYAKRSGDKSGLSLQKNSVREKSGFSACFSESDDDNEALKQRKFFC